MMKQDDLKNILHYNPETGVFTWLCDRGGTAKEGTVAGTLSEKGYIRINIYGKIHAAHRLAFLYMLGVTPQHQIDHINRIRHDNRFSNLRVVTPIGNARNRSLSINNKTGVDGVSWDRQRGRFKVCIYVNNRCINIGRYLTLDKAKEAREYAKRLYHPIEEQTFTMPLWDIE